MRSLVALVAFALAGACATYSDYPSPNHGYRQASQHRPPRAPVAPIENAAVDDVSTLALCPTNVTNAPPADRRGRVSGYTPTVRINGVELSRTPVAGCLSSGFGPRVTGGVGKYHNGIDLYTKTPKPIYAAADGIVEAARWINGYGQMVLVRHGRGVKTRYAHLSSYSPGVRQGARIRAGEAIGLTGSTGNATAVHLHYEIIVDGVAMNPLRAR